MKAQFLNDLRSRYESEMKDEYDMQIESGENEDTANQYAELVAIQYYVVEKLGEFTKKLMLDLKEGGVTKEQYNDVTWCIYEQIDDYDDLFPDFSE